MPLGARKERSLALLASQSQKEAAQHFSPLVVPPFHLPISVISGQPWRPKPLAAGQPQSRPQLPTRDLTLNTMTMASRTVIVFKVHSTQSSVVAIASILKGDILCHIL
jgi:hypothetical protein